MKTALVNENILSLIKQLESKDGYRRELVREALVAIGKPAVPMLIELLMHRKSIVRWEACKTLGEIKHPAAAPALVTVLEDENIDVQWAAAEALIALESNALVPLLTALVFRFDSPYLKQGAIHILRALKREHLLNQKLLEVLNTLKVFGPRIAIPIAAQQALNSIRKSG